MLLLNWWNNLLFRKGCKLMKVVQMKQDTDCEVAMIATACQVDYETAKSAIGWRKLPFGLENPVYGNPYTVYFALLKLGFWKQNLDYDRFMKGESCCVLVHFPSDPYLKQHWIVRDKLDANGNHFCYFGKSDDYTIIDTKTMHSLIFKGYPNCMFKVYKCNIFDKIYRYIRLKWHQLVDERSPI